MKLSEMLTMYPQLDVELGPMEDRVFLDGVYLFRALDVNDDPGEAILYMEKTSHTDNLVQVGMLKTAIQITNAWWPVHVCDGGH